MTSAAAATVAPSSTSSSATRVRARRAARLEARARTVFALGGARRRRGDRRDRAVPPRRAPRSRVPARRSSSSSTRVVSRVEFEIGTGSAIPTQLVLVPMLFALPIGARAGGRRRRRSCSATVADRPWPLRDPARVLPLSASAAHALGPALVIALAGGLPLRWSAWPIYLAALARAVRLRLRATRSLDATREPRRASRTLLGFIGLVYARRRRARAGRARRSRSRRARTRRSSCSSLPLVGAAPRTSRASASSRIDHALELSDAYRGTAFLLGDVVEADDAYTGSHSRHVVDLVLGVCRRARARREPIAATPSSSRCCTTSARSASRLRSSTSPARSTPRSAR